MTAENQPDEQASAPQTASTFPAGDAERGLKEIRTRLLDLTNRNKLLNFRFPSRSTSYLRFVDVDLETVFKHITEEQKENGDKSLFLVAVPEPHSNRTPGEAVEKLTAEAYAARLGWNTSYDLAETPAVPDDDTATEEATPPDTYDGRLPVLHYIDRLNTISRNIADAAKTAIEESGANMLYLSLGFLEWYESDDSEEPHLAPLITLPVSIDRTPGRGQAFRCVLEYSAEEGFETNLSLVEKMRRDMGLDIPWIVEDDSPEQYFARFADLLKIKKRWRIRRYLVLSLLDFGKFLMFRDLDSKNWPVDSSIATHTLVRELFEGTREAVTGHAEEFPIDDTALQAELPPLIRDADSSQHSALIDALRGKNIVIQGPPGTGKSQTITNLIAEAMARGKTVLFVADKLAALQVVRDRMDECGLGPFCLELHSHKTKKGELLKDIARRIDLTGSFDDPVELSRFIAVAEGRKKRLAEYVALIKEVIQPIQQTVFDILWARESAYQSLPIAQAMVANIVPLPFLEYTPTSLAEAKDWLAIYVRNLSDIIADYGATSQHPWCWVQRGLSFSDEQSLLAVLPELVGAIDKADAISRDVNGLVNPAAISGAVPSAARPSAEPEWTIERVRYLPEVFRALESAPADALDLRSACLETKDAIHYLRETAEKARRLQSQRSEFAVRFDLNVASPDELAQQAAVIEQTSWFARWFSGQYRKAVNMYKKMARDHKRVAPDVMSGSLRLVASYHLQRIAFDKNAVHRERIGVGFVGIDSKWDRLLRLADWYEKIFAAFPDGDPVVAGLRAELLTNSAESLKALQADRTRKPVARAGCVVLGRLVKRLSEISTIFNPNDLAIGDAPMATILPVITQISAGVGQCLQELATEFGGIHAEKNLVERTIHLLFAVGTGDRLIAVHRILSPEYDRYLADVRSRFADLQDTMLRIVQFADKLAEVSNGDVWRRRAADSLVEWRAMSVKSLDAREALQDWINFVRCRLDGEQYGMAPLTAPADDGSIKPEHLAAAFTFVFYNTLAKHVMSRNPALWEFSGENQDEIRKQFARADREVIRLQRKRAAAQAANRVVPHGNKTGSVKTWTELALLQWQISRQKRHISIRQIVHGAGVALRALKPCFMMGPQSVAKYLRPGDVPFDLVVMDEASQIRPEDAIGAMARARQAVIVGDGMQLPPTNFFNRAAATDDEDDEEPLSLASDSESILDVAASVYSSRRRLRWHYRSQHESLIAFSNQHFYDSDLVIFPAALSESESLGLKYRYISPAVYENKCNRKEADAVVDAVLDHMKNCANESLGVVAMNAQQRDLIEGLWEERLRDDPFAQSFRTQMVGTKAFFVKNLENVQGDERDVIFISTTYGPDSAGNQFQRFGPIIMAAGHRRLNVLFTRAKLRTVVFTSLDTGRILAGPESSRGLRAFKGYLSFARTGVLDETFSERDQPDSDFERSVKAVLEARNYEVVPQVGAAGFFIDLGVKNPRKLGEFLLGVECDGATYHSSRSARDRDRLREEILRSRGWTLHRIWSTDWFKNRNREIEKMCKKIESMLQTGA